ncbi:MAG TPA: ABC transporter ATP-binding protein [Micromonosporaceae bacterium]|jgi:iron(III) transport system ATP-binding protein
MTGFDVRGVHKSYGGHRVLRGVDLVIETGSLTAILGASGSGKTTLLRVLAGFERADAGKVTMDDRVVDDGHRHVAPERRRVGYVPQEGALFPHLSVAGNVAFGLDRTARRGSRVNDLLELVGLADLGHRYPHQLSGGQQQRVALARALAINPAMVLLDEPFSSLDAALRASVRADVVTALRTAGATALLVTHDQDEALSMADRVAVLRDGVIAQIGAPQQLYDRPADVDLASFLGEANVVPGRVQDGRIHTALGVLALQNGSPPGVEGVAGLADRAAVAIVRPEQIRVATRHEVGHRSVDTASAPAGVAGLVQEIHYFGHDTVMLVRPADGGTPLRVRIAGAGHVPAGATVTLTALGPVAAFPAPSPAGNAAAIPDVSVNGDAATAPGRA